MKLSKLQRSMLRYMARYYREHGYPPTIREILHACPEASSTSVVQYNLKRLEEKGLLKRAEGVSRGIRLHWDRLHQHGLFEEPAVRPNGHRAPVVSGASPALPRIPVLGVIAAGEPIQVVPWERENADEWLDLTSDLWRDPENLYALRVQGDSMIDASVMDGDVVIMRHQERANNGEMVAVWIEEREETTLKYFYLRGDKVELRPANPNYAPQVYPADKVRVQGKVVSVIRALEP